MLLEYIRNRKGEKIGVVVALNKWSVGYSLCKKGDRFDKQLGLEIAVGRAEYSTTLVPRTVKHIFEKMAIRANRYFK